MKYAPIYRESKVWMIIAIVTAIICLLLAHLLNDKLLKAFAQGFYLYNLLFAVVSYKIMELAKRRKILDDFLN